MLGCLNELLHALGHVVDGVTVFLWHDRRLDCSVDDHPQPSGNASKSPLHVEVRLGQRYPEGSRVRENTPEAQLLVLRSSDRPWSPSLLCSHFVYLKMV